MRRTGTPRFIVSFHTTADAMDTDALASHHRLPGRLMPVPRALSAGCGIAYAVPVAAREGLLRMLSEAGIEPQDCGVLDVR